MLMRRRIQLADRSLRYISMRKGNTHVVIGGN